MGDCGSKVPGKPDVKNPSAPVPRLVASACGLSSGEVSRMQDFKDLKEAYDEAFGKAKEKTDKDAKDGDNKETRTIEVLHGEAMKASLVDTRMGWVVKAADKQLGLDNKAAEAQETMCTEMGDGNPNNQIPDNALAQRSWREAKAEARGTAVEKLVTEFVSTMLKESHGAAAAVETAAP